MPTLPLTEIGRTLDAAGIATNYHDVGRGSAVLLVHGSGPGVTGYANWRFTIPALAEQFRVIVPDMAGFGYSGRPAELLCDVDLWVDQLVALLDGLDLRQASVVGNSFGGAIALRLAVRYPDRVDKLVLMGSVGVPFALTEGLDAVWGYQPSLEAMRGLLQLFLYDQQAADDDLAELRYRASVRPGFQESFARLFPAPRQRWIDAMTTSDEKLRALGQPTLLVHGRSDQIIPVSTSLRLAELIPRAELHLFDRCGHWSQIDQRQAFNELVTAFLARDTSTAAAAGATDAAGAHQEVSSWSS